MNANAWQMTRKHGSIRGWESAMWRAQEAVELADTLAPAERRERRISRVENVALPAAYIRRSVASRSDPGDVSREFQVETVRKLAGDDAPRLVIIDADWGKSAANDKTDKRLAFLALLGDIEAGRVSALYAYSTDRLARSVQWSATLLNVCRLAGVPIVTREGRIEPGDAGAALLFNVLAAVNENALSGMEAKARATVARRQERNVAAGLAPNAGMGRPAYGKLAGEKVALVLEAFDAAGSFLGGAKLLNAKGVPTRLGLPGGWDTKTVSKIVRRNRPDVPIVGRRGARARATHLFSSLLVCPIDGSLMSSMPRPNGGTGYICRIAHTNPSHARPYVVSEAFIRPEAIIEAGRAPVQIMLERAGMLPAVDVAARLADLDAKRERIVDMYADGTLDKMNRDRRLAAIDEDRDRLDTTGEIVDIAAADGVDWNLPPGQVNATLRRLWRFIELGPDLRPVRFVWRPTEFWTEAGPTGMPF